MARYPIIITTIAGFILLVIIVLSFCTWKFRQAYLNDVKANLQRTTRHDTRVLKEEDIRHLPVLVQRYLRYAGVINKPRVHNMRVVFEGRMREKGKDWFPFRSEQDNFYDTPTRLFFMKGKMYGVNIPGYHAYRNGNASMKIMFFGLLPIIHEKGGVLDKAETVTMFNDMCLLAPATLIDTRIRWQSIDTTSVIASFTCNGITISAILLFNEKDQLVSFISDDRYAIADRKRYTFSTPVKDYRHINGVNLATFGEAIWHYPDGQFTYGEFRLNDVEYNIRNL